MGATNTRDLLDSIRSGVRQKMAKEHSYVPPIKVLSNTDTLEQAAIRDVIRSQANTIEQEWRRMQEETTKTHQDKASRSLSLSRARSSVSPPPRQSGTRRGTPSRSVSHIHSSVSSAPSKSANGTPRRSTEKYTPTPTPAASSKATLKRPAVKESPLPTQSPASRGRPVGSTKEKQPSREGQRTPQRLEHSVNSARNPLQRRHPALPTAQAFHTSSNPSKHWQKANASTVMKMASGKVSSNPSSRERAESVVPAAERLDKRKRSTNHEEERTPKRRTTDKEYFRSGTATPKGNSIKDMFKNMEKSSIGRAGPSSSRPHASSMDKDKGKQREKR